MERVLMCVNSRVASVYNMEKIKNKIVNEDGQCRQKEEPSADCPAGEYSDSIIQDITNPSNTIIANPEILPALFCDKFSVQCFQTLLSLILQTYASVMRASLVSPFFATPPPPLNRHNFFQQESKKHTGNIDRTYI